VSGVDAPLRANSLL